MRRVTLTRVVEFSAAHRYFRPDWSPERNAEVFGTYSSEHGHGHRYECHVTVSGPLAEDTGMIINLRELDAIVREEVTGRLDHKHLNHDVPEFAFGKTIPTCEALAVHLWDRIVTRLPPGIGLERVRVQEHPHLFAEYSGEGAD
jgi:6-pyruvoyltetrahydropterin/6-carboxytetrahydropterin synthase